MDWQMVVMVTKQQRKGLWISRQQLRARWSLYMAICILAAVVCLYQNYCRQYRYHQIAQIRHHAVITVVQPCRSDRIRCCKVKTLSISVSTSISIWCTRPNSFPLHFAFTHRNFIASHNNSTIWSTSLVPRYLTKCPESVLPPCLCCWPLKNTGCLRAKSTKYRE